MSATDFRKLGRKGGTTLAAHTDMRAVAARARKSSPSNLDYWRDHVRREQHVTDESDLDARARASMRLHFQRLGTRSAAARRRASANRTP